MEKGTNDEIFLLQVLCGQRVFHLLDTVGVNCQHFDRFGLDFLS
jgi:hypothetical protein